MFAVTQRLFRLYAYASGVPAATNSRFTAEFWTMVDVCGAVMLTVAVRVPDGTEIVPITSPLANCVPSVPFHDDNCPLAGAAMTICCPVTWASSVRRYCVDW